MAPNLRGFEKSSSPAEVSAYRAHLLVQDIAELAASESADGRIEALVAHDWGGAFGWGYANQHGDKLGKLVIINSPHPGTFTRELLNNPAQQAASAYMNFLARPDAEALLSADDYKRMWPFFTLMKAGADGFGWLTEEVKNQYREVWNAGLTGACNLYRVTPMKPALPGQPSQIPTLPRERLVVDVPDLRLLGARRCGAAAGAARRPGRIRAPARDQEGARRHALDRARAAAVRGPRDRGLPAARSVDRRLALRPRLEAAMHPVVLRGHGVDVALQALVHQGGVGHHVVGREVLPGRQHLDLVALRVSFETTGTTLARPSRAKRDSEGTVAAGTP